MSIKQKANGKWLVEIDRKGIPRIRKQFAIQTDAEMFEREYLDSFQMKLQEHTDRRTLKELIEVWYRYHGVNLASSEAFKRSLIYMADRLGNPIANQLTPEMFVNYRYARMVSDDRVITAKTINNLHGLLSSVFNKLKRLKIINYDNPLAEIEFIKIHDRQLTYLSRDQIDALLESIQTGCRNKSTWFVTNLCLRTGCRWNEANQMKRKQLHDGRVTFEFTKSKRIRSIPLDDDFYQSLLDFSSGKNPEDRIFTNAYNSFKKAVRRAEITLPKGQLTHVLRHSFASHFMMKNGNILTLKNILGHYDLKMTLRYAHLSPDHLADAVKLNPLVKFCPE